MIAAQRLRNITFAVAGVAMAAAISKSAGFNASTAGFAFLLVVLFSATGLWPGITASVFATACFNYFFLPPIGTFHIAGSADWAALAAFLTVAIVASRLVTRAATATETKTNCLSL